MTVGVMAVAVRVEAPSTSYLLLKKGRLKGLLSCGNAGRRGRFVVE